MVRYLALALLGMLAGCAARTPAPELQAEVVAPKPVSLWETLILAEDRARLEVLPRRRVAALAVARSISPRRYKLDADVLDTPTLVLPTPPPGPYRCRRIRITETPRLFVAQAPGFCAIQSVTQGLGFVAQTGTERPDGWLLPDGETRYVFLGGDAPGKTGRALGYGAEPGKTVIGAFERIGDFRWRLIIPRAENGLDIIEMVPVAPKMRGDRGAIQASDAD